MIKRIPDILWFLSLISALMFFSSYITEQVLAAVFLITLAAIWKFNRDSRNNRLNIYPAKLLWVGGAFWLIALNSVIFSELPATSYIHFGFLCMLPLGFLLFASSPEQQDERLKFIVPALSALYIGMAVLCLYQYYFMPHLLFKGLVKWPFNNPNNMAAFMSLGFFGALTLWLLRRSWLTFGAMLLIYVAILSTGGRGSQLFLLLMMLPLLYFTSSGLKDFTKSFITILCGMVLVYTLFSFSGFSVGHESVPVNDLVRNLKGKEPALYTRPLMWASMIEVIKDHWLTGTGIGTFRYYYPEFRFIAEKSAGIQGHSDPLQFLMEMGIASPILFYVFAFIGLDRTVRAYKTASKELRIKILGPFLGLGAMVAHAHLTFNFYSMPVITMAGIYLALWYNFTGKALENKPNRLLPHLTMWQRKALIVAPLCLLLITFTGGIGSQILMKHAYSALQKGNVSEFQTLSKIGYIASAGRFVRTQTALTEIPLMELQTDKKISAVRKKKLTEKILYRLELAQKRNPRQPEIYLKRAKVYAMNGDIKGTEEELSYLLKMNPQQINARLLLISLYEQTNRKQDMLQTIRDGIYWTYISGDVVKFYKKAIEELEKAGDTSKDLIVAREKLKSIYLISQRMQALRKKQKN